MENNKLPNATAVLVLGILSIITCWCYGVIGIVLAVVALFLAKKDSSLYKESPERFDNYQNLNIGRVLAIIGLVLSVLFLAFMVWIISVVGMDALQNEDLMRERIQEYFQS